MVAGLCRGRKLSGWNRMEHPRLRPFLTVARDPRAPDQLLLFDQLGFCARPLRFSGPEAFCVELLRDGQSLHAIHERARREVPDPVITLTFLEALVRRLE